MRLYSTVRLVAALVISLTGALLSVLAGVPEAALLAAPWFVLLAMGLSTPSKPQIDLRVMASRDRVLVDDDIELATTVLATTGGIVKLKTEPSSAFWGANKHEHPVVGEVEAVSAGRSVQIDHTLTATQWGAHDVGHMSVEFVHPYGLFRSLGEYGRPSLVRVHPHPTQLRELLSPWMVRRVAGTHSSRALGQGVEYADIRPYGPGDSPRDINWRVSARSSQTWVSQRHPDRATDVILLLDSFIESGHDVRKVFGLAVEAAVALAESHLGATDRVGLIEFGGIVRWVAPGTGSVQLQRVADALLSSRLYASAADKALPIMAPRALPPRSFVIALTPLLDDRFIEALFAARARGHDVGVIECVVLDDAVEPEGEATRACQVRRASLALWHAETAMLKDRMAAQGIAVARWRSGDHLDVAVEELVRRRRRSVRVRGR